MREPKKKEPEMERVVDELEGKLGELTGAEYSRATMAVLHALKESKFARRAICENLPSRVVYVTFSALDDGFLKVREGFCKEGEVLRDKLSESEAFNLVKGSLMVECPLRSDLVSWLEAKVVACRMGTEDMESVKYVRDERGTDPDGFR